MLNREVDKSCPMPEMCRPFPSGCWFLNEINKRQSGIDRVLEARSLSSNPRLKECPHSTRVLAISTRVESSR